MRQDYEEKLQGMRQHVKEMQSATMLHDYALCCFISLTLLLAYVAYGLHTDRKNLLKKERNDAVDASDLLV